MHSVRAATSGRGKIEYPVSRTATRIRSVSSGSNCKQPPLDNILRVVTVVQQIMTEFSGAVSEGKIVAITKIVLNPMKQNYH
jgi:hypothetical protein